jgi:hypothetical protein
LSVSIFAEAKRTRAHGRKTLDEKNSGESSARHLVPQIDCRVLYADCGECLGQLLKRRAELAGEIEATHERLRRMIEDLGKLDSVILQFDPTHQVEAIRPKAFGPPSDWARRGEMTKTVLSILRQA